MSWLLMRHLAATLAVAGACALGAFASAEPATAPGPAVAPQPAGPPSAIPAPPIVVAPAPPGPSQPPSLVGAPLYIYSFLDVRENEFSSAVIDQIDQQLGAALGAAGVTSKLLHFKDSMVGSSFAQVTSMPTYGQSHSTEMIPVAQTIASNLSEERAVGARYRLIEFPADFSVMGAWRYYKIRWMLMDCASGRRLWTYVYSGQNLIWWSNGERAESRAKPIVSSVMSQLKTGGLL